MKDEGPLSAQIGSATTVVYMAYHGKIGALGDVVPPDDCPRESLDFPESILSQPVELLENGHIGKARERRLLAFTEMALRCDLAYGIGLLIYRVVRTRGGDPRAALEAKKGPTWIAEFRRVVLEESTKADSELGRQFGPIIRATQKWKIFDDVELAGWVHENLDRLIDEIGHLWPVIHTVALTWKNKGEVTPKEMRHTCRGIFGRAFERDRELRVISHFYYTRAQYCRYARNPLVEEGVPFVRLPRSGEVPSDPISNTPTDIDEAIEELRQQLPALSVGSHLSAAVGRIFFLLHNGNFIVHEGKLRFVQFPVEPGSGEWARIDECPEEIHRFPKDYVRSARYALQFALGGFMWATYRVLAGGGSRRSPTLLEVEAIISKLWLLQIFRVSSALAAASSELPSDCSIRYAESVYARMAYLEGWWNPLVMREKLRAILKETYELLLRHSNVCWDLEEGIRCGLIKTGEDFLSLAGDAVDGRFANDEEYGFIMRYQRDLALVNERKFRLPLVPSPLPDVDVGVLADVAS
jgi:hypothetical protein